jgi:chemotaxis protein methyltransferase CheR
MSPVSVQATGQIDFDDRLSSRNFKRLAHYIYSYSGIKMPEAKMTMLEGRLRRRLRVTGHPTFDSYCDYVFEEGGLDSESVYLIDVVTTNKTDFFREPNHFDFMCSTILPELARRGNQPVRIWSSACSIGAEPYTIAMLMEEFATTQRGPEYIILATDLSTDVLAKAQRGIFHQDMIEPVPAALAAKYIRYSRNPQDAQVRIVPRLRSRIGFARLNLMDPSYEIGDPVDMIFCRNVLIYFDKETQQQVMSKLCRKLAVGGHIFIGHSESIAGMNLPLRQIANTVFKRLRD